MNGVELQIWEQRERDKQPDWLEELLRDMELNIPVRFIRAYDPSIDHWPIRLT